jgi:hypothetical protein
MGKGKAQFNKAGSRATTTAYMLQGVLCVIAVLISIKKIKKTVKVHQIFILKIVKVLFDYIKLRFHRPQPGFLC